MSRSLGWIGSTFISTSTAKGDMVASQTLSIPSAMSIPLEPPVSRKLYTLSGFIAVFAVGLSLGVAVMARQRGR